MANEFLFITLAFSAAVISGIIGFGGALILLPFAAILLPIKEAIAIITIFFLSMNLSKIYLFRKEINWRITLQIWYGAVPMVILGASLMVYAPESLIKQILGAIIAFYILNDALGWTKNIKVNQVGVSLAGGLYGFFAGIVGTGSPIKAALLTQLGLRKEEFVGTMAMSSLLLNVFKIIIYSKFALFTFESIPVSFGLVAAAVSGTYIGRSIIKIIPPELFRRLVVGLLFTLSVKLTVWP